MARDRERDRLLTLANVHRMRGQLSEAQETLRKALALSGSDTPSRADAPIHELLGDILALDDKIVPAKDAFDTAHRLDPDRASAERKYAQMTLRLAQEAEEKAVAAALLRGEKPSSLVSAAAQVKRNPSLALLLSVMLPGAGQLYNGQMVKGAICLAIYLPALLIVLFAPGATDFFKQVLPLLGGAISRQRDEVSPLLSLFLLLAGMIWIYAVIDAPMMATKTSRDTDPTKPLADKTGWEV